MSFKFSQIVNFTFQKTNEKMGFKPISIDEYVVLHLKNNPEEKEAVLRKNLNAALEAYENGTKCSCGEDIWVIGSAAVGNACFTCITGESKPTGDYELIPALKKRENINNRRHINDIDPTKISGFFDDDGYEINTELIKKPSLCLICKRDEYNEPGCTLIRNAHAEELEFECSSFEKI